MSDAQYDTPETSCFLRAFSMAWTKTLDDYCGRSLNGEHSLQASLYHHLRGCLPSDFRVFCEAVVYLGTNIATDTGKDKAIVDLLVEHESKVIGAIEIKFTPRGKPADDDICKDLVSLSTLTSRRANADRVRIDMPRFRSASNESLTLSILPQRKLIFAAYCSEEKLNLDKESFWEEPRRPTIGYWAERNKLPPNFGVALAKTTLEPSAKAVFFGPPFERLGL